MCGHCSYVRRGGLRYFSRIYLYRRDIAGHKSYVWTVKKKRRKKQQQRGASEPLFMFCVTPKAQNSKLNNRSSFSSISLSLFLTSPSVYRNTWLDSYEWLIHLTENFHWNVLLVADTRLCRNNTNGKRKRLLEKWYLYDWMTFYQILWNSISIK